jgi:hypothetical protein
MGRVLNLWVQGGLELDLEPQPEQTGTLRPDYAVHVYVLVKHPQQPPLRGTHAYPEALKRYLRPTHCREPSVVHASKQKAWTATVSEHAARSHELSDRNGVHISKEQERPLSTTQRPSNGGKALVRRERGVKEAELSLKLRRVPPVQRQRLWTQQERRRARRDEGVDYQPMPRTWP